MVGWYSQIGQTGRDKGRVVGYGKKGRIGIK